MPYHNKKFDIAKVAIVPEIEISNDIIESLSGKELGNKFPIFNSKAKVYSLSSLNVGGKRMNDTTKLRMKNLQKQLKGFGFFVVE